MMNDTLSRFLDLLYDSAVDIDSVESLDQLLSGFPPIDPEHPLQTSILAHVCRAEKIRAMLRRDRQRLRVATEVIDHLPIGIMIVGMDGSLLATNDTACREIAKGRVLTQTGSSLHAVHEAANTDLRQSIACVDRGADDAMASVILDIPDQAAVLTLLIRRNERIARFYGFDHWQDVVVVTFPAGDTLSGLSRNYLTNTIGLTDSEARTALAFVLEPDIAQISRLLFKSEYTIRSQLKATYNKMDIHSQSNLIKHFMLDMPVIEGAETANAQSGILEPRCSSRVLHLASGENLSYNEYGDQHGTPVIFLHSAIGSRLECSFDTDLISQHGIRMIAPERPGYGLSSRLGSSTFMDWAGNIEALADHLGLYTRFPIISFSGGSAYALACALRIPHRIRRIELISPMGEISDKNDLRGMMPFNKRLFSFALRMPGQITGYLGQLVGGAFLSDPETYLRRIYTQLPDQDRQVLDNQALRALMKDSFNEGVRKNPGVLSQELCLYSRPWDMPLDEIDIPVHIMHGDRNRHIPFHLAQKLARSIPGCRLDRIRDGGYFILYAHWDSILEHAMTDCS